MAAENEGRADKTGDDPGGDVTGILGLHRL
jgi:hypothetical protein